MNLIGRSNAGFLAWVDRIKSGGNGLDRAMYTTLEKPSEKVPVMRFGAVDPALFKAIVEQCVAPGKPCMSELMQHDTKGGMTMPGVNGGKGPFDQAERPEGALSKDGDEKGSGKHWSAPADIKRDGGSKTPGKPDNRDHTMLTPHTLPGSRPVAVG